MDDPDCYCDVDHDGFLNDLCGGDDCNDSASETYPGADEQCDELDNDCDGEVPEEELNLDLDGYRGCKHDCDDSDPQANPAEEDVAGNGIDDDCNGYVDEPEHWWSVPVDHLTIHACSDVSTQGDVCIVAPGTYVENVNFQGKGIVVRAEPTDEETIIDGDELSPVVIFESGEDPETVLDGDDWDSYWDCDDAEPITYPGADDVCDGLDNDCDGRIDELCFVVSVMYM